MSGARPEVMKKIFLPPQIGGINIKDPAIDLPPQDGLSVVNYYCFESSLWSRGAETVARDLSGTNAVKGMHNWVNAFDVDIVVITTDAKVFVLSDTTYTATDITGAVTMTNGATSAASFNNYLFLCNGTNAVIRVDRSPVTSAAAFVGPAGADATLNQVCSYKKRLYFVQKNSNSIWYGGVGSVTGALTEFDITTTLDIPSNIYFCTNWTLNQGIQNEELFVIVTRLGEVLIYSGDWPAADNWQLIGKTQLPRVLSQRSFCKLGGDIIIYTELGPVRLSDAVRSGALPSEEFQMTRKISKAFQSLAIGGASGTVPSTADRALMVRDDTLPFIYVISQSYIYVMNYQTGAWSIFTTTGTPTAMVYAFKRLMIGYSTGSEIVYIQPFNTATSVTGAARNFTTGWLDFGEREVSKHIVAIRLYSSVPFTSATTSSDYTVTVYSDLLPNYASTPDAQTITGSTTSVPIVAEFKPGAVGRWFQIDVAVASGGSQDEYLGMEIEYVAMGGAH